MENKSKPSEVIAALIFSVFEEEGPMPKICYPDSMDNTDQLLIAMKSISLLMGEQVYQEGKLFDSIKYFGILPFPDIELTGLTYFFLIHDEGARGKAKASTISLLVKDNHAAFLYENMKQLSVFIGESANKMVGGISHPQSKEIMRDLLSQLQNFTNNINAPVSSVRKIKILFTGLDASGKTSFLRAIKQKYSELIGIKPTKGIERSEEVILGQSLIEWDIGGQQKYRQMFLKEADLYLYDTNLLFFLVDSRDENRYEESLKFFSQIINVFKSFKQYPPICVNMHKYDPDANSEEFIKSVNNLKQKFRDVADGFSIKFYETSIFKQYSLVKSFSEGITAMSPNREIFQSQLKWLAGKINAEAIVLINDNSIILSDYSTNEATGKVSEMSAPYFQSLFKTFSEFQLLKRNNAIWRMDEDLIVFYNISINNNSLYLLCMMKDRENVLSKFEESLPEFVERTKPLIETYL
jgi:Ras-related GTP-binding protein A/B